MRKTYYDVLGVARNADEKTIRGAYRKLVLQFHPDHNSDPLAAEMFIRITRAYEALVDPERRKSYDRLIQMEEQKVERRASTTSTPRPVAERKRDPGPAADIVRLTALLNRGRFNEAEILAQRLVKHYPREAIPYAVLADIARYRGDLREATRLYAYAAQMDPRNPVYQRKHEELLDSTSNPRRGGDEHDPEERTMFPLGVGAGIVIASGAYLALSREEPLFKGEGPVSTWTLGLCVMLFLSGVAMGAALTIGGLLDRFWATRGAAVMRFPPSLVLGLVALVNFWAALALYFGIGASQNAFNPSTSRMVGAVAVVTGLLAAACALSDINPMQTLTWGGNVVYIGALCGWMVADGFRE